MSVFLLIVTGLPVLNLLWWWWGDRRLRRLPRANRWRLALAAFMGLNLAVHVWLFLSRLAGIPLAIPTTLLMASEIWHLVVVPAAVACLAVYGLTRALASGSRWLLRRRAAQRTAVTGTGAAAGEGDPPNAAPGSAPTRRQMLAAAVVALPPIAAGLGQARALAQLDHFRLRRLEVALPALPPALDGLTIAHVSDVHVGRFTSGTLLRKVSEQTNALRADLVLLTGDLIDFALADLPAGLDMIQRMDPRHGLFLCEGNHDLFESRAGFERRVKAAGVPLLLNESALLTLRGEPVQILGLRWGRPGGAHGPFFREQLEPLLALRQPGAFAILLAHHPHAFDRAAEAGIPLTLSGHTHGGQLMLSRGLGAGPLLFRYWSGLYRHGDAALVVSNGVGNWFPLRINAPAEILHLTLRASRHRESAVR